MGIHVVCWLFHSLLDTTTYQYACISSRALQYEVSRAWFETHRMHSRERKRKIKSIDSIRESTADDRRHGGNEFGRDGDSWPMKMHYVFGWGICFAVCETTWLADTPWELAGRVQNENPNLFTNDSQTHVWNRRLDWLNVHIVRFDHHPSSNRTCFYFASSSLSTQPREQVNRLFVLDTDWQRWLKHCWRFYNDDLDRNEKAQSPQAFEWEY